jgi:hypothetical protein
MTSSKLSSQKGSDVKVSDIVKNAPNALIWGVTIVFLGILAAFTVLSATGSDTTDLRAFLNLVLNIAGGLFSGGAVVLAGSAAKSAHTAVKQTNGLAEAERVDIAKKAAAEAVAQLQTPPVP